MKQLPLPVRVAAGLAVTAMDQARHLPEKLAELPVTVVSQALQLSMRVQQRMTELAIKGDDALSSFRPVEETPDWARFDEDEAEPDSARSAFDLAEPDPWTAEQEALADDHADGEFDSAPVSGDTPESGSASGEDDAAGLRAAAAENQAGEKAVKAGKTEVPAEAETAGAGGPDALPNYAEFSLPQLRARLRRLSEDDLAELVEYERAHADRPDYVGMLTRRIATLRARQ